MSEKSSLGGSKKRGMGSAFRAGHCILKLLKFLGRASHGKMKMSLGFYNVKMEVKPVLLSHEQIYEN